MWLCTKSSLHGLIESHKVKELEENLKERQKMFNLAKEDDEASAPHFIKKARIFNTKESADNVRQVELQAKMLQEKIERERLATEKINAKIEFNKYQQ